MQLLLASCASFFRSRAVRFSTAVKKKSCEGRPGYEAKLLLHIEHVHVEHMNLAVSSCTAYSESDDSSISTALPVSCRNSIFPIRKYPLVASSPPKAGISLYYF